MRALKKKGFVEVRITDQIYLYYYEISGNKTPVFTKFSLGSPEELGATLISRMARQLELRKRDLIAFVECPLSRDSYETILREKGLI